MAFLNRTGVIDAVLSDDVDTFVFGGTMVVRKCVLSSPFVAPVADTPQPK